MTSPPPDVPAGSWYDHATMTWHDDTGFRFYTVDTDGNVTATRDYTDEERAQAARRRNEATLIARARAAIAANTADAQSADAIAANTSVTAATRTLAAQSSRQAKQLNALIRLAVKDLTSTEGT